MWDDLSIDERGRFQMASDDLVAFVEFLRENEVAGSAEEPNAFTAEGRSYGYGRLHNLYDEKVAVDLHHKWRSHQEAGRAGQAQ